MISTIVGVVIGVVICAIIFIYSIRDVVMCASCGKKSRITNFPHGVPQCDNCYEED